MTNEKKGKHCQINFLCWHHLLHLYFILKPVITLAAFLVYIVLICMGIFTSNYDTLIVAMLHHFKEFANNLSLEVGTVFL